MSRTCEDDIAEHIAGTIRAAIAREAADRPDPITLQAHDDLHDHDHGRDLSTPDGPEPWGRDPLAGKDVFNTVKTGPWRDAPLCETAFGLKVRRDRTMRDGEVAFVIPDAGSTLAPKYAPARPYEEDAFMDNLKRHGTAFPDLPAVVEEDKTESLMEERSRILAQRALEAMEAHLPADPKVRKGIPLFSGCINYFPDALAAVAQLSRIGNDQHNPGQPLHWAREKSGDELDALSRHLLDAGTFDNDGSRHSVKVAWRALANLQKEIEAAKAKLEPIFREPQK